MASRYTSLLSDNDDEPLESIITLIFSGLCLHFQRRKKIEYLYTLQKVEKELTMRTYRYKGFHCSYKLYYIILYDDFKNYVATQINPVGFLTTTVGSVNTFTLKQYSCL